MIIKKFAQDRSFKLFTFISLGSLILVLIWVSANFNKRKVVGEERVVEEIPVVQKQRRECENYEDIQHFKNPIQIVWTARFDGCLVSCRGAYFTRVPEDSKYPRFSGYVPDEGEPISEEYMKDGQILKIYGKWVDVSDSYGSIFDNKCVPTVDIEKIEIVK